MSDARLTALRLVGFKSFAERTVVEFGPGISAVVGPNGSGKSNLADALRWTLGEQGRSLRTRRSEDVIFAGSSSRRAIGMADVTLVIDNADGLLPVDFGEVEIGRRLYRSGENEYLLNRQRIRLRDLVELLDAGNLADNAFLFIGQGMVDQALALRPEERRPLFEEAAGVRRHERRRRQAEAELTEAESNLERLRDLLVELRPQARRLAAQAEQLQARRTAGLELAEALVEAARSRWMTSSGTAHMEQQALEVAHAAADAAMAELRAAEEEIERTSEQMGERAERERAAREALDVERASTMELRLDQARLLSELRAVGDDRRRVEHEMSAADGRAAEARRVLSRPLPVLDASRRDELAALEREEAGLRRQLDAADPQSTGSRATQADAMSTTRRERELEQGQAQRRTEAVATNLVDARQRLVEQQKIVGGLAAERDATVERLDRAVSAEGEAEARSARARTELATTLARQAEAARRLATDEAQLAAIQASAATLEGKVAAGSDAGLAKAARARGGSLLAEGLEVEPSLRVAVSAALGAAERALTVEEGAVPALRAQHGALLITTPAPAPGGPSGRRAPQAGAPTDALLAAAAEHGGGPLSAAIRRDPQGHVTRLLGRAVWVPTLEAALATRRMLPPGWRAVSATGEVIDSDGLLHLAGRESMLELRAALEEERRRQAAMEASLVDARAESARATETAQAAQREWDASRRAVEAARSGRRAAEEAERVAQRRAEAGQRELDWQRAQVGRLEGEQRELTERISGLEAALAALVEPADRTPRSTGGGTALAGTRAAQLRTQMDAQIGALSNRRERLLAVDATERAARLAAEDARRRAEIGLAMDEARIRELDADAQRLAGRDVELTSSRDRIVADLAIAEERERRAAATRDALLAEASDDRARLLRAERMAVDARERLRVAEGRSRAAEVGAMEARLHLEQIREQLLIELASIGPDGLTALAPDAPAVAPDLLGSRLEEALDRAVAAWEGKGADGGAPSFGRLAALRRRFHELGAGNPFAVQEHAEVRQRLDELEAQRADLERAIGATRELIDGLTALITQQFMATFAALEGAFARSFEQLFGGGEAQLTLTAPEDLSATGVEITARPPGKKRQPLAMLSGGERALTAVALLLAMLEVRPVPFCVLDEVDAALDEANISRFASALRALADRIQFIVITHNRGTIESADALYGVTIGDDAVSSIVSLRLPSAAGNGHDAGDVLAEAGVG